MITPTRLVLAGVAFCSCYYLMPTDDFSMERLTRVEESARQGAGWPNYFECNVVSVLCTGGSAPGSNCAVLATTADWCGGPINNERCDPSRWTDDCVGTGAMTPCPSVIVTCTLTTSGAFWTVGGTGTVTTVCGSYIPCL
jgi:hypothetical protein